MLMLNGRLPSSALTPIPGGRLAKGAPARSWLAMRYYIHRKRGVWLRPTGPSASYRTLARQQAFYAAYKAGTGALAAVPGTSNHGLGLAVDLPTAEMQSAVREHGHRFGWGIAGGRLPSDALSEPWHTTHVGGGRSVAFWYARYMISRRRK